MLMSVDVKRTRDFQASTPRTLFQADTYGFGSIRMDNASLLEVVGGYGDSPITVVMNWQAALKRQFTALLRHQALDTTPSIRAGFELDGLRKSRCASLLDLRHALRLAAGSETACANRTR